MLCRSFLSLRSPLFLAHSRELEHNVLARQTAVDRRKRVQLVFQRRGIFRVEQTDRGTFSSTNSPRIRRNTHTFSSLDPSPATRVLFPTISVGKTRSSRIFSCTLVRVRLRGRFCFTRELRVGLLSIRRCATNTTCLSENFFSSSRVSLNVQASSAKNNKIE